LSNKSSKYISVSYIYQSCIILFQFNPAFFWAILSKTFANMFYLENTFGERELRTVNWLCYNICYVIIFIYALFTKNHIILKIQSIIIKEFMLVIIFQIHCLSSRSMLFFCFKFPIQPWLNAASRNLDWIIQTRRKNYSSGFVAVRTSTHWDTTFAFFFIIIFPQICGFNILTFFFTRQLIAVRKDLMTLLRFE